MQKKINSHSDDNINENKGNSFKYIAFFIIFFVVGAFLGFFVGKKFIKESKDPEIVAKLEEKNEEEITDKAEYQETITNLKALMGGNLNFYNSNGFDASQLTNDQKLIIAYEFAVKETTLETATMPPYNWESQTCSEGFLMDLIETTNGSGYRVGFYCTYSILPKAKLLEVYTRVFNNDNIEFVSFNPNENYRCVIKDGEENYSCGTIKRKDYTGEIENHFQQRKVTIDKEETIAIYESGYLKDTRSFVNLPDDGFDNYYLHSSDSTLYYYELRSADNLTFKHIFKKDASGRYYYVKTENVKSE